MFFGSPILTAMRRPQIHLTACITLGVTEHQLTCFQGNNHIVPQIRLKSNLHYLRGGPYDNTRAKKSTETSTTILYTVLVQRIVMLEIEKRHLEIKVTCCKTSAL